MPPANVCPNCGEKEWLESPSLHYMPRLHSDEKGYSAELENGVNVSVWRCNNCMYIMQFWEPD